MLRRSALLALAVSAPVLLVALVAGGPWGSLIFVSLTPAVAVGLIALGVPGAGRRSRSLVALLVTLFAVLEGAALVVLSGVADGVQIFGLPASAWVMLIGLGGIPLLLVGIGHGLTFVPHGPRDERPDESPDEIRP